MKDVLESLSDGFGELPPETENLAKIAYIKNLAMLFGVKDIKAAEGEINLFLYKDEISEQLIKVLSSHGASLRFENLPIIKLPRQKPMPKTLDAVIEFFEDAKKS